MSGKLSAVKNPLTIIAIFSGIAEISGTAVLPLVSAENQKIFIWFLMLFPTYLVSLFFITLHKKPSALYAPSDFSDEGNYMATINQLGLTIGESTSVDCEKLDGGDVLLQIDNHSNIVDAKIYSSFHGGSEHVDVSSENPDEKQLRNTEKAIPLHELARLSIEESLGVKFDTVKSEMKNDLGYIKFDGVYYPPTLDDKLLGDIIFFQAREYNSGISKQVKKVSSLINETWKYLKNVRMIFAMVIKDGQDVSATTKSDLSKIVDDVGFDLQILYIHEKDLVVAT